MFEADGIMQALMDPERKQAVTSRLRRQTENIIQRTVKPLPEGTFESVQVLIREAFPDLSTGPGDMNHWEKIDKKVMFKNPNSACFQYYLREIDHKKLAKMVYFSMPNVVASINLGSLDPDSSNYFLETIESTIFKHYPRKYRERYLKRENSKKKSDMVNSG